MNGFKEDTSQEEHGTMAGRIWREKEKDPDHWKAYREKLKIYKKNYHSNMTDMQKEAQGKQKIHRQRGHCLIIFNTVMALTYVHDSNTQ